MNNSHLFSVNNTSELNLVKDSESAKAPTNSSQNKNRICKLINVYYDKKDIYIIENGEEKKEGSPKKGENSVEKTQKFSTEIANNHNKFRSDNYITKIKTHFFKFLFDFVNLILDKYDVDVHFFNIKFKFKSAQYI